MSVHLISCFSSQYDYQLPHYLICKSLLGLIVYYQDLIIRSDVFDDGKLN